MRGTKHHLLWVRSNWNAEKLTKSLRANETFQMMLDQTVHRLLHAVIEPPEIPDISTLEEMRYCAPMGLVAVINTIQHPIVEHLDQQLTIATVCPEVAHDLLVSGRFREIRRN